MAGHEDPLAGQGEELGHRRHGAHSAAWLTSWPWARCSRRTWSRSAATISATSSGKVVVWRQPSLRLGLGRVAQQVVDLERAEVARVDLDQQLAGAAVDALLVQALALPDELAADLGEGALEELAHAVGLAGRQHEIVGAVVLQDAPHALDIVAGMAPVAQGVEVAHPQPVLQAELDRGHARG